MQLSVPSNTQDKALREPYIIHQHQDHVGSRNTEGLSGPHTAHSPEEEHCVIHTSNLHLIPEIVIIITAIPCPVRV